MARVMARTALGQRAGSRISTTAGTESLTDQPFMSVKCSNNSGSGNGAWILAGMEWAIANGCQVISMSLGNTIPTSSIAYEKVGQKATAIWVSDLAAAGNNGRKMGTVGQPANSPSIMAVGAINNCLAWLASRLNLAALQGLKSISPLLE